MTPELDTVESSTQTASTMRFVVFGRAVLGVLLAVFLGPIWWIGQDCFDDPCLISRAEEWRGLLAVVFFGAAFLRIASSRYWRERVGLWVVTLVPALWFYRDLEPVTGGSVPTDGPDIAAAVVVLLAGYLVMAVITFLIEIVAPRSST